MSNNPTRSIVLHSLDNVAVAVFKMQPGEHVAGTAVKTNSNIPSGHKVAIEKIKTGEKVVKYGQVIGFATKSIEPGDHVHSQNLEMPNLEQDYKPGIKATPTKYFSNTDQAAFDGYVRNNGRVGTRNYIGVLASVSCSNSVSEFIADAASKELLGSYPNVDGIVALGHGSGCCMAPGSEGLEILQRTLAGYAKNPNFGAVLFVGLGCEVNLVDTLMDATGLHRNVHLDALVIQDCGGTRKTIAKGVEAIKKMLPRVESVQRTTVSAEHLIVGLECGGSDGYSGITANPALGAAADLVVQNGGTAILAETTEIYGAEHLLIQRAKNPEVAQKLIERINWWQSYTEQHGAEVNNNPTPGNKAGGITTIIEKSMGAVAKAGSTNLNEVYRYGEQVQEKGLVFMDTPGYDVVSITGMIAGGANMVCFTTGRGTVCGFRPVPTLKLASNTEMYDQLSEDMDINCGKILDQHLSVQEMGQKIFQQILNTASGKQTKSELLGFGSNEFVPWHIGAVL